MKLESRSSTSRSLCVLLVLMAALSAFSLTMRAADLQARVVFPRLVMLGDSLIQGGEWAKHFPGWRVHNLGVGGDTTAMILDRLDEVIKVRPDVIVVQAGINDISQGFSSALILENHRRIWRDLIEHLPDSRIILVSLLPVSERKFPGWNARVREINFALQAEVNSMEHITFVNLYQVFGGGHEGLQPGLTYDGIHLTKTAYEIWAVSLKKVLGELKWAEEW